MPAGIRLRRRPQRIVHRPRSARARRRVRSRCVLKGEGEAAVVPLLEAIENRDEQALLEVPGVVAAAGRRARRRAS